MPSEITMPQLSDTMTEGTVVKWHKQEGDKVKAGEEIADIETSLCRSRNGVVISKASLI